MNLRKFCKKQAESLRFLSFCQTKQTIQTNMNHQNHENPFLRNEKPRFAKKPLSPSASKVKNDLPCFSSRKLPHAVLSSAVAKKIVESSLSPSSCATEQVLENKKLSRSIFEVLVWNSLSNAEPFSLAFRCKNSGFSLQIVSTKRVGTDSSKFWTLAGTENSTAWYSQYHGQVTSLPLSGSDVYDE